MFHITLGQGKTFIVSLTFKINNTFLCGCFVSFVLFFPPANFQYPDLLISEVSILGKEKFEFRINMTLHRGKGLLAMQWGPMVLSNVFRLNPQ